MKKLMFGVGLLFGMNGLSHAYNSGSLGTFDSNNTLWKSSDIAVSQGSVVLTTGIPGLGGIMLGYVQILSTGSFSTIQFQECTSTSITPFQARFYGSSVPTTGGIATTTCFPDKGFYVMEYSTMGWAYSNLAGTGGRAAAVRILYIETPALGFNQLISKP